MAREISRRVIEHLRAGVPSLEAAELLMAGRRRLMGDVAQDLLSLAQGRPKGPRVVAGNYGEGKSHTLSAVHALAQKENFVVSWLTVSRETPLDRIDRVYRKIVRRTYLPGVARPGVEILLRRIAERPESAQRLLRRAEHDLHPKLAMVLEARLEGAFGPAEELERDLSGYFLSSAEARRAYQAALTRRSPKVPTFRTGDAISYLRLLDEASVLAGYSGWVLLLDEIEMLGRLGRVGRAKSYALLERLFDPECFPHSQVVLAVASSFQTDLEDRLAEAERLPQWLAAHGRTELQQAVAPVVRRLRDAVQLAPLSEDDLAEVFAKVVAAHAEAFGWQPGIAGRDLLRAVRGPLRERDTKVRQLVRAAVHYLDLYLCYGEAPALQIHEIAEAAAAYDESDDEPSGAAAVRDWPD